MFAFIEGLLDYIDEVIELIEMTEGRRDRRDNKPFSDFIYNSSNQKSGQIEISESFKNIRFNSLNNSPCSKEFSSISIKNKLQSIYYYLITKNI